jgi:periplasmic protein TonB
MNTQETAPHYGDALEILFAHKNRAYGAYQLRRAYPTHLAKAFGSAIFLIFLGLLLPRLLGAIGQLTTDDSQDLTLVQMTEIILPEKPVVPPPVEAAPPPAATRNQQRFAPPLVAEDNKVREQDPPTIDELIDKNADVGIANVTVDTESEPDFSDQPDLKGGIVEHPQGSTEPTVYDVFDVQKPPSFPGGDKALFRFLSENIQYPTLAREAGIQGPIYLSFVVGKNGEITDIQVLKDALGGGLAKEAVRVLGTMPRWSPGEANGQAVRVRFSLPVRFTLQ